MTGKKIQGQCVRKQIILTAHGLGKNLHPTELNIFLLVSPPVIPLQQATTFWQISLQTTSSAVGEREGNFFPLRDHSYLANC